MINNKPQENIEKCFEEIKQVLKKYECDLYPYGDLVKIKTQDGYFELYGYQGSGSDATTRNDQRWTYINGVLVRAV